MWIRLEAAMPEHRKTKRFARLLGVSKNEAIGLLVRLWVWALTNATADGALPGVDKLDIADALSFEDADMLLNSLMESGFIDESCGEYSLHDWSDYSGKYEAKKEQDRTRQRNKRDRERQEKQNHAEVTRTTEDGHAEVTPQNRREETILVPPYNPPKGEADQRFSEFYAAYPRKQAKQAACKAWDKLKPDADTFAALMSALEVQKRSPDWQREEGRFIPYPATWLNGRRWEDSARASPPKAAPQTEVDPFLVAFYEN